MMQLSSNFQEDRKHIAKENTSKGQAVELPNQPENLRGWSGEKHLNQLKYKIQAITQLLAKKRLKSEKREGLKGLQEPNRKNAIFGHRDKNQSTSTSREKSNIKKGNFVKNKSVIEQAKVLLQRVQQLNLEKFSSCSPLNKTVEVAEAKGLPPTQEDELNATFSIASKENREVQKFVKSYKELLVKFQNQKKSQVKKIDIKHQQSGTESLKNKEDPFCQTLPVFFQDHPRVSHGFMYGQELGRGKFGQVFLARHLETGFLVAIKKVQKQILRDERVLARFIEEIKLHSKLNHPNIVKFYGFFEEKDHICLVLEFLNGGTLFDHLNEVYTLDNEKAVVFLKQIISALKYLHERKIMHRDIKPENIVISSTGLAKLCDFGWSALGQTFRTTFCGTLDYASPQMIEQEEYDQSIDVWCVGVLTYELLLGRAPFQSQDRDAVMRGIVNVNETRLPYLDQIHPFATQFIEAILKKNPQDRPKIYELLSFPFFEYFGEARRSRKMTLN